MKKIYLLSLLMCLFLMTGCTKNYKTVSEYVEAMNTVKAQNNAYILEASIQSKEPGKTIEQYHRTYIKGNKWKTDLSIDGGSTYTSSILNTGNKILMYSDDSPYAMKSPLDALLKDPDEKTKQMMNLMHNPIITLIDWNNTLSPQEIESLTFVNNNDIKNGFPCRLISDGNSFEICVSDKLGIGVYEKISFAKGVSKSQASNRKNAEMIINLMKADTKTDITDDTFNLPAGKKEISFEDIMKDMSKMFSKMGQQNNNGNRF